MRVIPDSFPQKVPRGILFDWDNTLVDTTLICYEAMNKARQSCGLPLYTLEQFYKIPHKSVKESFPEIFSAHAKKAETIFYNHLFSYHLDALRPLPGVEKLLQWLLHRNIYMAVVSNKAGPILRKELAHLGWNHYFEKIIGSGDAAEDKPSPQPLLAALQGSKLKGRDVWFVGDSSVDIICAQKAGCVPVAVGEHAAPADSQDVIQGKNFLRIANILENL